MLGRIVFDEHWRMRLEDECVLGLPLRTLRVPARPRGLERRLERGAGRLVASGVTRVLVPQDFGHWPALEGRGLRSVDTGALRAALLPKWVEAALALRGVRAQRATLTLRGGRESHAMERAGRALCPLVQGLSIDVPGGGGLAAGLRREFGLPVLPAGGVCADLTVVFSPDPELPGFSFGLKDGALPDGEVLPALCALWETGRIALSDITLCPLANDFP